MEDTHGVSANPNLKDQETGASMLKGRRRWISRLKQRTNFPLLSRFVLFGLLMGWMMLTYITEGELYSVY